MKLNIPNRLDSLTLTIIFGSASLVIILGYISNLAINRNLISPPKISIPNLLSSKEKPSKHVLAVTEPIFNLQGTIYDVSSNSIILEIVKRSPVNNIMTPLAGTPTPSVTPSITRVKVDIMENVSISKTTQNVPYLLKNSIGTTGAIDLSPAANMNISDLSKGDMVIVTTDSDLRVTDNPKALSITVQPKPNSVSGTISSFNNDSITITGTISSPIFASTLEDQKEYTFQINDQTEISGYPPIDPSKTNGTLKAIAYKVSDLKIGQSASIHFDTTTNTAQLLMPIVTPQIVETPILPQSSAPAVIP